MVYPNSNYFDIGERISSILRNLAESEIERDNPEIAYVRCGTHEEQAELHEKVDYRFHQRVNDFCEWLVESYIEVADEND